MYTSEACWTALPEGEDDWIDAGALPLGPRDARWTWAGDAITVGPHELTFALSEDGLAGYEIALSQPMRTSSDLVLGGELGPARLPGGLRPAGVVALTSPSPGAALDLAADSIPLSWDAAAPGRLIIEVRGMGSHRLFGPRDDGEAELALDWLGPRVLGDAVEIVAWRLEDLVHDVNGNQIVARSAVRHPMVAAVAEPGACIDILQVNPESPSGPYPLQPDPLLPARDVWCDMETDGGGWTLVAASAGQPLSDKAGPWHDGLALAEPSGPADWIWDGLRGRNPQEIRFTCRHGPADDAPVVDLSFRGVDWYRILTTGTEEESCFLAGDTAGTDVSPARRDNLTGETRAAGVGWSAGTVEGEDRCRDPRDFTIDFDDRGLDGDQSDGTDWGLDDDMPKCGIEGAFEGSWSVWVR